MKRNNKSKIISLDKFIFKALYDPKIGYYDATKNNDIMHILIMRYFENEMELN